ncbi:MAG TPA: hypothetical protein PK003_10015 [Bacillota bacterium]|jgi:hypothetical protein|nr:hypothetical protein [Bacillota bacterium]
MFPVKARIVEIAIERYKSLREDRLVPSVASASENTTWPTSADSTVARPTAVMAMLLDTACPKVWEPITYRRIAEGVNAASSRIMHRMLISRVTEEGYLLIV